MWQCCQCQCVNNCRVCAWVSSASQRCGPCLSRWPLFTASGHGADVDLKMTTHLPVVAVMAMPVEVQVRRCILVATNVKTLAVIFQSSSLFLCRLAALPMAILEDICHQTPSGLLLGRPLGGRLCRVHGHVLSCQSPHNVLSKTKSTHFNISLILLADDTCKLPVAKLGLRSKSGTCPIGVQASVVSSNLNALRKFNEVF